MHSHAHRVSFISRVSAGDSYSNGRLAMSPHDFGAAGCSTFEQAGTTAGNHPEQTFSSKFDNVLKKKKCVFCLSEISLTKQGVFRGHALELSFRTQAAYCHEKLNRTLLLSKYMMCEYNLVNIAHCTVIYDRYMPELNSSSLVSTFLKQIYSSSHAVVSTKIQN
jgi:hypothetical protein